MKTLKTDVIIPAYRPGEEFEKLLERLSAQKYPINKILVMNTEKKFWKETWEQEYPLVEVQHLTKEEFDHGGTRRQAAELSDAEILVFMTQDAMPADRELIGALVGALAENPQAGAAYARQLPKKDCRFLEKYTRSFNYPEQSCLKTEKDVQTYGIKTYFCSNVCAAYDHRIIFSGSFLYRFPRKYPAYLETLCKNSPGISHMWPVFRRYAMLFFTSRMPSPSEGTPSKTSGCSAWETPRSKFLWNCCIQV